MSTVNAKKRERKNNFVQTVQEIIKKLKIELICMTNCTNHKLFIHTSKISFEERQLKIFLG